MNIRLNRTDFVLQGGNARIFPKERRLTHRNKIKRPLNNIFLNVALSNFKF
jgi:hypothetical protein